MKLNNNFLTHITRDEHYMISTGDTSFKGIVKNNETAAFIIECLKNETTENQIVDNILKEYSETNRNIVEKDVANTIEKLCSIGAIDE